MSQTAEPAALVRPSPNCRQFSQAVWRVPFANFPGAHSSHSFRPDAAWCQPGAQSTQLDAPGAALNLPASHWSHVACPEAEATRPGSQISHSVWPDAG